jgi:predicted oxidoreductase (fatty acid repression mutant protein)
MKQDFLKIIENRRSYYDINKLSTISDKEIQQIIEDSIKHVPSAFNSQSGRVVLLLDDQHDDLWNIVENSLKAIVPSDRFGKTREKINSFRIGYGTVLFFEDKDTIKSLQEKFPSYAHNFPLWSQQSSGMLQFAIWVALEAQGLGASLQHYNELIEKEIKENWNINENWQLISQMPFGKPVSEPGEKDFLPIDQRFKKFM